MPKGRPGMITFSTHAHAGSNKLQHRNSHTSQSEQGICTRVEKTSSGARVAQDRAMLYFT